MRKTIEVLMLVCMLTVSFFAANITITTSTLGNPTSYQSSRHILQAPDGTLVAFYGYSAWAGIGIRAKKSTAKGASGSWTNLTGGGGETLIGGSSRGNIDFSVCMDTGSNIYVVYACGLSNNTDVDPTAAIGSSLAGNHDNATTTITVLNTANFLPYGAVKTDSEIITYTNKNATMFLNCTRGALAASHTSGVTVIQNVYQELRMRKLTYSGGSWTVGDPSKILAHISDAGSFPRIYKDENAVPNMIWITTGSGAGSRYWHSIDDGVSWQTAQTTLTGDISSAATTLTVADNTAFFGSTYNSLCRKIRIDNEYLTYAGKSGTTLLTGCARGLDLTQAVGHTGGVNVVGNALMMVDTSMSAGGLLLNWKNAPALIWKKYNISMNTWTGTNWSAETTIATYNPGGSSFPQEYSATITTDDKIHLVFPETSQAVKGIKYRQCSSTGVWDVADTILSTDLNDINPSVTTDGTDVYVFWAKYLAANQYDIVYKKYSGGTWDPNPTYITTNHTCNKYPSTCLRYDANMSYVPVIWAEGTVTPWNVKYSYVALPPRVTNLNAATGSNAGTTTITITGTNFYGALSSSDVSAITLDTAIPTSITTFTVESATTIVGVEIPSGLSVGSYNVQVTNSGGTNSTSTVKFVVTAPSVTVTNISPTSGANETLTTLSIFGGGFFGGIGTDMVTAVRLDTSPTVTTLAAGYSVVNDTLITGAVIPSGLTAGTYNVMVTASGSSNTTSTVKFNVKVGPKVTGLNPLTGSNIGISTITISGSGYWPTGSAEVTSIKLMDTSTEVAAITGYTAVNDSTIQTAAIAGGLSPGSYWVKVTTTNGVNATGAYFSVITSVPTITSLTPSIGGDSGTTTISINGTGFWGGTTSNKITQIRLETSPTASTILGYNVISNSLISNVVIPAGLSIGSYDIKVQSCGVFENVGGTKFTIANGPQVTSLSRTSSTNLTATALTVTGQYFTGASVVNLDDPLATALGSMSVVNATTITGIIPAGLFTGTYNVKVTTPAGTNVTSTQKFTVTGLDPVVSTVVPATSVNTSAFTVTLTGTGYFGGKASGDVTSMSLVGPSTRSITTYSVISDSLMDNVVIPSQVMCGTYDVRVKTHGGENLTSGNKFVVTGVSPTVVTVTPQTNTNVTPATVTVTGTNFYGGTTSADVTSAKIGATEFTSFSVVSNTSLTGVVPTGITTGSYDVIVTTRAGENATSEAKYIVTTSPPTVTNLSPNKGGNTGFTTISITGTKFFGGAASSAVTGIQLDTGTPTDLTSYSVISNVLITAQVPIGVAVGTYNVKVTTTGGTNSTSTVKYQAKAGPTVAFLSPTSSSNITVTYIYLEGTNFYVNGNPDVLSMTICDPLNTSIGVGGISSDWVIDGSLIPGGLKAGTYDIKITTSNGTNYTSAVKFSVTADPPTITNANPLVVNNAGSSYAVFAGTGFFGGSTSNDIYSLKLSGSTDVVLGEYTVVSDTGINNVRIPIGTPAGTYDVIVTTGGGSNDSSHTVQITVLPAPLSVTELSPSSCLNTTAATITVKGIGFFSGMASSMVTSIKLDDVNNTVLSGWSVLSDTQINNVIVPLGMNSGRYNVKVTAGAGTNTTSYVQFDVVFDSTALTEQTVESPGIKLTVPEGALSGNTVFLISDASAATDVVSSNKTKYTNLRLWPYLDSAVREITLTNGVTVNSGKSVTVTLTYSGINDPALESKFRILRLGADNKWALASSSDTVDFINHKISSLVDHFSIFRIGQFVATASNLDNVVIFPNPVTFDTSARSTVKFKNLTADPIIRIFTVSGELVKTINPLFQVALTGTVNDGISGEAEWDGTNENGEKIARGIYLYMITDSSGRKKIGKIVVK